MFTCGILDYFGLFLKTEKPSSDKKFLRLANDVFKNALSGASWFLYVTAVLLLASCLYYYYFEQRDRRAHIERVRELQDLIQRTPPKRRPGARGREREVFRNVLEKTHSFIYPDHEKKAYVVRQTRSGTVYGRFVEGEEAA